MVSTEGVKMIKNDGSITTEDSIKALLACWYVYGLTTYETVAKFLPVRGGWLFQGHTLDHQHHSIILSSYGDLYQHKIDDQVSLFLLIDSTPGRYRIDDKYGYLRDVAAKLRKLA